MTCRTLTAGVVICGPDPGNRRKRYLWCPTCQCTTEQVVSYDLWRGSREMCCRCGDSWSDGELCPRPFERGWRRKYAAHFRTLWDLATHGPAPDFEEELQAIPPLPGEAS